MMRMTSCFTPLFILSSTILPITPSPTADLYRSHVIDHFLQKKGRLDKAFTEYLLNIEDTENNKRNAAAGAMSSELPDTLKKHKDDKVDTQYYSRHPIRLQEGYRQYSGKMNVYEYPDKQAAPLASQPPYSVSPSPTFLNPSPYYNIYPGPSSPMPYHALTPPTYQGILKASKPTSSPILPIFLPPLATQTPTAYKTVTSVTPNQPSLFQSFFDSIQSSNNIQTTKSSPQIKPLPNPKGTKKISDEAETILNAGIVMKPFTFFNTPQKQGTQEILKKKNSQIKENPQQTSFSSSRFSPVENEVSLDSAYPRTFQQIKIHKPVKSPLFQNSVTGPSLFESINKPALDRQVRQKLTKNQPKKPKSSALEELMSIAGDNWEKRPLTGSDNLVGESGDSFLCPEPEGHFSSPFSCRVYYQCAQGTAHKHTCEAGLLWDMHARQCDWQKKVHCPLHSADSSTP